MDDTSKTEWVTNDGGAYPIDSVTGGDYTEARIDFESAPSNNVNLRIDCRLATRFGVI